MKHIALIFTSSAGGFLVGAIAGAGLGFVYALVLCFASRDLSSGTAVTALIGFSWGMLAGSVTGIAGGAMIGVLACLNQSRWVATILASVGGCLAATLFADAPVFALAKGGWTIFPLAAIFAAVGGWILSTIILRLKRS